HMLSLFAYQKKRPATAERCVIKRVRCRGTAISDSSFPAEPLGRLEFSEAFPRLKAPIEPKYPCARQGI
ncbi:MAG: hypothetical protein WBM84_12235, partial [Sedimenticolaceae bacterium]